MSEPSAPERIVGHFKQEAEDGNIELQRIELELRHWEALYAITVREESQGGVLRAIFEACAASPDEPLEATVIRYIERNLPSLPDDLGEIVRT